MIGSDPAHRRALLAELLRRKDQRAQPIALSAAQRRLWLLGELEPGTSTYNVPVAFRLRGPLDRRALERALNTVVRRHDVLRAIVTTNGGEPAYAVDENFALALPLVESGSPAQLDAVLAAERALPFNLGADVPIRTLLVRSSADDHVLLVTLHHIATDGWSMAIFKRELGALYAAYRAGEASPLAEAAATYADFAAWQRGQSGGPRFTEQVRYWTELLADAPPPLDVAARPGDVPAEAAGGLRSRTLEPAFHAALQRFSRAHATTVFSTLFAAFTVLLHRYTGRRDFIVGSAVANRTRSVFEELIGFFVNTLPLRARIEGDPAFGVWLAQVHRSTLDAFDHQDIPFQALVEALNPTRVSTRTPLVNVMFVLQNAPDAPLALAGLDVSPLPFERTTAKFDLTLEAATGAAGELTIAFEYRTDLFDAATIEGMLEAFETLVREAVRDPNQPLSRLPLLTAAAAQRRIEAASVPPPPLTGRHVERLFEHQAERQPDAVAVVDGSERLTYRDVNERANQLARCLRAAGASGGSRVGLCAERGAAAIVGLLAILKAGGVYVPLDPEYPHERLAHMLSDADVQLVLTDRGSATALAGLAVRLLPLECDAAARSFDVANLPASYGESAGDPAYVLYTSGSTGLPKGVVVAHVGIERLVTDPNYVSLRAADGIAQASTLAFDASTFEIWAALLNGARLVIVPRATLLAPDALRAAIERFGITVMFVSTALLREIVRTAPATFGRLDYLLVGGEALDAATVQRLLNGAPPAHLRNMYGPTETTTFATWHPIETAPSPDAPIAIGRPIVHTEVYLLDAHAQPLPVGAMGELYIGGPGVALGYLNDAELSRTKFVRHPFRADPAARLYVTGDRARLRANGDIEFAGRADGQLKRRGFRIEPAEIEAALRADADVDDAAVVARDDDSPRIVAFVTSALSAEIDNGSILRRLRTRLPAFMIPDAVVAVPHLPLNRSGKVDREELRARALPQPAVAAAGAPHNETQAALRSVWEQVLGVAPIGIDDNFFDLGGHSLLAVRLTAAIEAAFQLRLPLALLFEQPTIEQLARALGDPAGTAAFEPAVLYNAGGAARPLFFLHGSINGGGFYCKVLADRLGSQRPLYAVRPYAADGQPLPATIEAMAAEHVAQLKVLAPRGPYLLGGFCAGGLVAFEMARRLRAGGDDVANVILIDVPDAPRTLQRVAAYVDRSGALLGIAARHRLRLTGALARIPHHRARFAASSAKLDFVTGRSVRLLSGRRASAGPAATAALAPDAALLAAWTRLTEAYVPLPYDGRLTLLLTRADDRSELSGSGGWSALAPQVELHAIPGTHLTCIAEFVDGTAHVLADALAGQP